MKFGFIINFFPPKYTNYASVPSSINSYLCFDIFHLSIHSAISLFSYHSTAISTLWVNFQIFYEKNLSPYDAFWIFCELFNSYRYIKENRIYVQYVQFLTNSFFVVVYKCLSIMGFAS